MRTHFTFLAAFLLFQPAFSQHVNEINVLDTLEIGGIPQVIQVKAKKANLPILLFLHGGPGSSLMPVSKTFTDELKDHFTLVQWDQRETGQTKELNQTFAPFTYKDIQADAAEMVHRLLKQHGQQKLFLLSHSWGSVPGFYLAQNHPECLHAYIAISPIIDQERAAVLTMEMLEKWARKNENELALQQLDSVAIPFKSKNDLFLSQKWLFIHNGVGFAKQDDFRPRYYAWMDVWFDLWLHSVQKPLESSTSQLECPIFFFEGIGDKQKSHYLVKDYYKSLDAPLKKFYWFRKSGHTVFNTEPEKIQHLIVKKVLPLHKNPTMERE